MRKIQTERYCDQDLDRKISQYYLQFSILRAVKIHKSQGRHFDYRLCGLVEFKAKEHDSAAKATYQGYWVREHVTSGIHLNASSSVA